MPPRTSGVPPSFKGVRNCGRYMTVLASMAVNVWEHCWHYWEYIHNTLCAEWYRCLPGQQ